MLHFLLKLIFIFTKALLYLFLLYPLFKYNKLNQLNLLFGFFDLMVESKCLIYSYLEFLWRADLIQQNLSNYLSTHNFVIYLYFSMNFSMNSILNYNYFFILLTMAYLITFFHFHKISNYHENSYDETFFYFILSYFMINILN